MDTVTTLLLNMVKAAIAFLLTFFPLQHTAAQDAGAEQKTTLRIKMIKEVDGKVQVTDTTVQAEDHAALPGSIKGLKVDTAMLRRLNAGLSVSVRPDTTVAMTNLRKLVVDAEHLKPDTAAFHALHGGKVKAFRMHGNRSAADREAMVARVKDHKTDTLLLRAAKGDRIIYLKKDSAAHSQLSEFKKNGEVVRFRTITPSMVMESSVDSAGVFRLRRSGEIFSELEPNQIERIIVRKNHSAISIDSLVSVGDTKIELKVVQDKTGEKKVYKVDEKGNEVLLKGEHLKLDHGDARIMILMKARVEEITAADKEALKEAGAAVEMKKKEALDVERISFYPNPNNGRFNLNFTLEDKGTTRVSVMDSKGEEVFVDTVEKLAGEYSRQIDLTPFGRGIYYLQIAQGGKYHTKKILVQ
ncbi:hypothetical protein GCM10027443_15510 [Pontibacter brevis]